MRAATVAGSAAVGTAISATGVVVWNTYAEAYRGRKVSTWQPDPANWRVGGDTAGMETIR